LLSRGLDPVSFERSRKKRIGAYLRLLNSPEALANEYTKYKFKESDLFQFLPMYEAFSLEEANARLQNHFNWDRLAVSIVKSERS